jgi:hypothetical protein
VHAELTGIGPYRLTRTLAAGDTHTLYLGHLDGDPDRQVSVAVLHAALASDATVAEAFAHRARVALRLRGAGVPNVAAPLDSGVAAEVSATRPWVASEPVDGVSLEQLIAEKKRFRLPIDAATNLFIALLDALAGAARLRVVHGRLRASDIWLSADGRVRVTGFGADDDPRADFLALARLAQEVGTDWVPEVDAWLDALQREEPPFASAKEARAAFPLTETEAGRSRLLRTVKASLKKRDVAGAPSGGGAPSGTSPGHQDSDAPAAGRARLRRAPPIIRRPATPEEAERAAREARRVAVFCGAVFALGLLLEVM